MSLVQARIVLIALPEPGGADRLRIAAADGEDSDAYGLVGMDLELGGSKTGRVLERGRSERVDSVLDDPEIDQQAARRMGVRSALYVPLVVGARADWRRRGARQARYDIELHRRGRAARRIAGRAGRHRGRAVRARQPGRREARRRGAGERAGSPRTRAARRDRPGADLDPARAEVARGSRRDGRRPRRGGGAARAGGHHLQDVRRLAVELRPAALDDFGLVPAIERLRDLVGEQGDLSVDVRLGARRPAPPRGDGDRALSDRAGGVDEHPEARGGASSCGCA